MSIRFGEFVLNSETLRITRNGQAMPLSPKAFQLLEVLIEARPRVVSKNELIDRLWPDVTVQEANVRNLISEIRQGLNDSAQMPRYVRTAHRTGYAFIAKVSKAIEPAARLFDEHHSYVLSSGENFVGREVDCSVLLESNGVSRHHAKITLGDDGAVIEDLRSKNGTWVNGERIGSPFTLRPGDEVRIGKTTLTFRTGGRATSTASLDT